MNEQRKTKTGEILWKCLGMTLHRKGCILLAVAMLAGTVAWCCLQWGAQGGYQATVTWSVVSRQAEITASDRIRGAEETAQLLSELLETDVMSTAIRQAYPELSDFLGEFLVEPVEECGYLLVLIRDSEKSKVQMAAQAVKIYFPELYREISQEFSAELLGEPILTQIQWTGLKPWQGFFLAAAAVSAAGVYLLCRQAMAENRIFSPAQVRHLEIPVAAVLPWEKKRRLKRLYPLSGDYCEQIRRLCRRIEAEPGTVFAITSPGHSQGRTTLAVQLAGAMAMKGYRTALVELDFRSPGFGKLLRGEPKVLVNELLLKRSGMPELRSATVSRGKLHVLFGGQSKRRAEQLLKGKRLPELLEQLREFDCVILDTPPVGKYPDTQWILPHCDGAFLVAGAGLAPLEEVRNCAELLRWGDCPFLGCILSGGTDWDWKNGGELAQ